MLLPADLQAHVEVHGPWFFHAAPSEALPSILEEGIRPGPGPPRIYCSEGCRRLACKERDPDDLHDDAAILAVRERLELATWADERCRCEWPLAAVDADDTWRCVKCARPLAPSLPPAA
jgi:hypothetical protein